MGDFLSDARQRTVFRELYDARVELEGMILKPNMVIPGQKLPKQASPEETDGRAS